MRSGTHPSPVRRFSKTLGGAGGEVTPIPMGPRMRHDEPVSIVLEAAPVVGACSDVDSSDGVEDEELARDPHAALRAKALQEAKAEGLELITSDQASSGFKGVSRQRDGAYLAKAYGEGKPPVVLGHFTAPEQAALAYARHMRVRDPSTSRSIVVSDESGSAYDERLEGQRLEACRQAKEEGLAFVRSALSSSGYKGVSWSQNMFQVRAPGSAVTLGRSDTAEEAALIFARYVQNDEMRGQRKAGSLVHVHMNLEEGLVQLQLCPVLGAARLQGGQAPGSRELKELLTEGGDHPFRQLRTVQPGTVVTDISRASSRKRLPTQHNYASLQLNESILRRRVNLPPIYPPTSSQHTLPYSTSPCHTPPKHTRPHSVSRNTDGAVTWEEVS